MDTQRLILWLVFSFSGLMLWQAWEREHNPPPVPTSSRAAQPATPAASAPIPSIPAATPAGAPPATASAPTGQTIEVHTDLYTADIDTVGGTIDRVALAKHRDAQDPSKPYLALQRNAERTYIAQAGLIGEGFPNHRTVYEAEPGPRTLAPGQDQLQVKLQATAANGDKVVQALTFHRGTYVIDVTFDVTNNGAAPISPEAYFQLLRDTKKVGVQSSMAPASFVGPVVYNEPGQVQEGRLRRDRQGGGRPDAQARVHAFDRQRLDRHDRALLRRRMAAARQDAAAVLHDEARQRPLHGRRALRRRRDSAGRTGAVSSRLYVGPQDQDTLAKLAKGLDLVVDYGIFTIIAEPLFALLKWLTVPIAIRNRTEEQGKKRYVLLSAHAAGLQQREQRLGDDREDAVVDDKIEALRELGERVLVLRADVSRDETARCRPAESRRRRSARLPCRGRCRASSCRTAAASCRAAAMRRRSSAGSCRSSRCRSNACSGLARRVGRLLVDLAEVDLLELVLVVVDHGPDERRRRHRALHADFFVSRSNWKYAAGEIGAGRGS